MYADIVQKEYILETNSNKYSDFTWLEPVVRPVQYIPSTTQERYIDALIGNNKILPNTLETIKKIKILVRSRYTGKDEHEQDNFNIQVWLMPGKYTISKKPRMIRSNTLTIIYRRDSQSVYNRYIEDMIKDVVYVR